METKMTPLEIIQLVISLATLIATAFVPIMIYWLQKKHEKEIEGIRKAEAEKELTTKANEFLIDHENERGYLPLCFVASALFRLDNHTRAIYTDFCRCSDELQDAILNQAGIKKIIPISNNMVDNCLASIKETIKEHKLGRDYLYDGEKYFHRGYERYKSEKWNELRHRRDFDTIATGNGFYRQKKSSLLIFSTLLILS